MPVNKHRLATPELHIIMRDDSEFTVRCYNADLVAWDRDRAKHAWPLPGDAPFMWLEYLAWHAMTKTHGLLPQMTLREFGDRVASIVSIHDQPEGDDDDDDDEERPGVDPTRRDPEDE